MNGEAVASVRQQDHKKITEITRISLIGEEDEIGVLLLCIKKKREYMCQVVRSDKAHVSFYKLL
jgi:hypothetical protein